MGIFDFIKNIKRISKSESILGLSLEERGKIKKASCYIWYRYFGY